MTRVLTWLTSLPDVTILALASAVAVGLVLLTGLVARRVEPDSPRSKAALEAYKIIVTFSAILLSFCLVQAQGTFCATEAAVSRDAGSMNQLDRVLLRYDTPATARIRPMLHDYIRAVLQDDWQAVRNGGGGAATVPRLTALNQAVQRLEGGAPAKPQLYGEVVKHLDSLNDSRQERVDASGVSLPGTLWEATGLLCLVLLVLPARINVPGRFIAIGGHAIAIAILAALVFIVDLPFRGESAVSPDPIARVLATVVARSQ